MSNPFRRESRSAPTNTAVPTVFAEADQYGYRTSDLSVNTKVPTEALERHVSFASPPVDSTIPAAEYPSSPESVRFSPPSQTVNPILPAPTDYSVAIQSDPFRLEDLRDQRDGAIKEALQNAKQNTVIANVQQPKSREDAVKDTLSRFPSGPRDTSGNMGKNNSGRDNNTASERQAIDVEAFKRLLLTGDSGQSTPKVVETTSINSQSINTNDSSSSADTASLSQRSMFENLLSASESTPRSSQELDPLDVRTIRNETGAKQKVQPPPTPNPRRGKPVKRDIPETQTDSSNSQDFKVTDPPTQRSLSISEPVEKPKRPPTPPLARRQSSSAKGGLVSNITRRTSDGDPETASIPSVSNPRAPPPPPTRRRESATRRGSSLDLEPTVEEPDPFDTSDLSGRKPSDIRPPPPPSRNSSSAKRASLGMMSPPPIPPPRRNRGSSRSSIDSHRPSMSVIMGGGGEDSARSSGEFIRPGTDSRRVSTASNANSILADLASLQRELDEARKKGR